MSARVYNPMILSEISKLRSPALVRRPVSASSVSAARVKRDLFGPVDKEDSKKFIERELAAHNDVLSKKWGFDFRAGQPLQNHDQYQWERVPPTSAPACFTGMVTLTRAAHIVSQSSTTSEDLLDQRAERENRTDFSSLASPVSATESDHEMDSCEAVRTYPLVLRSDKLTTIINKTNITSNSSSSFPASATRAKRQQRITDYLKERKRLASGAPKTALAKKARQMFTTTSSASSSSSSSGALSSAAPRSRTTTSE
ncbi:cyclin-dependent kinase inhibitor 1B [Toxorhynchites rutilus septentrionalis]|uniref:cyclin-dependent kinase inhibitor 1B n=1 Tax=Toxorhynchites rutilus septentrionalis TaxID=329112 RepID=UPI002479A907|nr:cyclin-dependent kinase inhibitor 1B [Toxorhynchites rutilus septentrionalis]